MEGPTRRYPRRGEGMSASADEYLYYLTHDLGGHEVRALGYVGDEVLVRFSGGKERTVKAHQMILPHLAKPGPLFTSQEPCDA